VTGAPARVGIPWLVSRFKQYVLLRERLLTDTQGLRARLGDPLSAAPAPAMPSGGACQWSCLFRHRLFPGGGGALCARGQGRLAHVTSCAALLQHDF